MMLFREKQQLIICAAAVVTTTVFLFACYLPLRRETKLVKRLCARRQSCIADAAAKSKELVELQGRLTYLQQTVGNYQANIPSQRALGEFLHRIADLMKQHRLTEPLIEPQKEIKVAELTGIPLNIRCKGELEQLFEFYKSLQQLDRLVRIEQVELINGKDLHGKVSMWTRALILYRPEPQSG